MKEVWNSPKKRVSKSACVLLPNKGWISIDLCGVGRAFLSMLQPEGDGRKQIEAPPQRTE